MTYLELVRSNTDFRRLWMGDVVSLLGDWFNTIAIYTLLERLSGSPFALGLVFIIKMSAYAVASPLAGVIADRFDRRRLMIGADLLRAVVVLGFLWIDSAEKLPLLYVLIALQIAIGSVFRPARSASLPNLTRSPQELLTANALMASTWSSLLAFGAALGGFATEWLGETSVFLLDSGTYLLSAWFIWRARLPQPSREADGRGLMAVARAQLMEGWRYLLAHPRVGRMALAKTCWASGGSALVYSLAMLGPHLSSEAEAVAIGALFAARGLGTGVGPIAARAVFKDWSSWPRVMGLCILASGAIYMLPAWLPWRTEVLLVPIVLAHALSGANWVLSSVLLQERTEDKFRGRVFATEWLLLTLVNVVAIGAASLMMEYKLLDLRGTYMVFGGVVVVGGLLWLTLVVPAETRDRLQGGVSPS